MSDDMRQSVLLITGSTCPRFGTGFIVHRDQYGTYLVTCAHVVHDVGSAGSLVVNNDPILRPTLVASGAEYGIDLAVVRVEGLFDRPVVRMADDGASQRTVTITGFRRHTASEHALRSIRGSLGSMINFQAQGKASRVEAWDLTIEGEYYLAEGYSGSPVRDETSRRVVGVASHLEGDGRKGQAITIAALAVIWSDIPPELIAPRSHPVTVSQVAPTVSKRRESPHHAPPALASTGGIHITNSTIGDVAGVMTKTVNHYYARQQQPDPLVEAFVALRQAIAALANLDLQTKALQRVTWLEEATSVSGLDLALMESAVNWFRAHCPTLLSLVWAIIAHPLVMQRVADVGETASFQQRFGRRGNAEGVEL